MAFFHSFTESLKQKWLQFFQVNRDWITLHMQVESVYTPDGGKRPPSYLILGVANALEPKLAQLMLPFSRLNPDADTLIEVLELNFDPDIALGNRFIPKVETEINEDESSDDDLSDNKTLTNSHENGFSVAAMELDTDEETLMILNTTVDDVTSANHQPTEVLNGVSHNSLDNDTDNGSNQTLAVDAVDDFGDISFGDMKDEESTAFGSTASTSGNEFADVLSDVWGDESATKKEDADNDMFLGEDLSSGDLDDSEIASLFPSN
ncbi:DUF5331 domain-containing protein [Scytonema sp. NUACC21]